MRSEKDVVRRSILDARSAPEGWGMNEVNAESIPLSANIKSQSSNAPVAQLDRVSGYEPEGRRFESFRARHFSPVI